MSTIKDVAAQTGLGVGTISRYLNSKPVNPENRKKIEQAIKKLGYRRNEMARGLKINKTYIIGVLIPDLTDVYATTLVRHIEREAYAKGYNTITCDSWGKEELEREKVDILYRRGVDGLVIFPANECADYLRSLNLDIPVVMINSNLYAELYDTVVIDNNHAGYQTGTWFLDNNHRRVGIITQQKYSPGRLRTEGCIQAFRDRNVEYPPELLVDTGFALQDGFEGMRKLLSLENPPTAVFTTNYYTTLGAIKYFNMHGISIPDELSFIGFDDIGVMDILKPPISVVQQPMDKIGEKAANLLIERIQSGDAGDEKVEMYLRSKLIIRESCRALTV